VDGVKSSAWMVWRAARGWCDEQRIDWHEQRMDWYDLDSGTEGSIDAGETACSQTPSQRVAVVWSIRPGVRRERLVGGVDRVRDWSLI
jgi:hypothetical protein